MIKKILMLVLLCAPLSMAAQKVATFDYAEVMQALPAFRTAQTELETVGKKYQADLEEMQKEIQTKVDKYRNEVNEQTPANIRQRREQEINDLQQRYQQAQEDNQQAFAQTQQSKMQPIITKLLDAVKSVQKDGGYVILVDKSSSQAAGIFVSETLSEDVTSKVMDKLGITAADRAAAKAAAAKAAAAPAASAAKAAPARK